MSNLDDAIERSRQMIREALVEARAELTTLQERQATLEQQIADAEAALGSAPPSPPHGQTTLHEAFAQVLTANGNVGMTARELADAVNAQGLYRKRDGSRVEPNQVHARVNNYGHVFEKDGQNNIRLREESLMLTMTPKGVTIFKDDDDAFFDWLDENPEGFVINTYRNPKPDYLVLHRPQCPHFKGDGVRWTVNYVKVCSPDRAELEAWARDTVQGELTLCSSCFGLN
jgi:hypothetical protein